MNGSAEYFTIPNHLIRPISHQLSLQDQLRLCGYLARECHGIRRVRGVSEFGFVVIFG